MALAIRRSLADPRSLEFAPVFVGETDEVMIVMLSSTFPQVRRGSNSDLHLTGNAVVTFEGSVGLSHIGHGRAAHLQLRIATPFDALVLALSRSGPRIAAA